MSILVDQTTSVLVQGATGTEGSRATREMLLYGTNVLAGVTPGKAGQKVHGILVYDSVKEALKKHPTINTSLIAVPAPFVKDAALEAIVAGIPLIDILTEHVPTLDTASIIAFAKAKGVRVIGPSSVGIISPGKGKVGSIGSSEVKEVFSTGSIGLISKSGGMTAEIASILTKAGLGQSTALGIGGDQLIASDFADIMALFEADGQTQAVVLFGEIGGTYEEKAAECILQGEFSKPVVAMIAGKFSRHLPKETVLGHAGAIVSQGRGSYESKIRLLKKTGVFLPETLEEIPVFIKKALYQRLANNKQPTTNNQKAEKKRTDLSFPL